jgi:hypothetical protein
MIENGHRELCRPPHILALAAALGVPPVELVPWVLAEPTGTKQDVFQ